MTLVWIQFHNWTSVNRHILHTNSAHRKSFSLKTIYKLQFLTTYKQERLSNSRSFTSLSKSTHERFEPAKFSSLLCAFLITEHDIVIHCIDISRQCVYPRIYMYIEKSSIPLLPHLFWGYELYPLGQWFLL